MPTSHIIGLLDKALTLDSVKTKGRLSHILEMGHPQLNKIYRGKMGLTEKQCTLLAETLGMQPIEVIFLNGLDRAKTEEDREWFLRRLPRFLAASATLAMAALIVTQFKVTEASVATESTGVVRHAIHYAYSKIRLTHLSHLMNAETVAVITRWNPPFLSKS